MLCNQASRKGKLMESSSNKTREKQTTWKQRSLPDDLADVCITVTPIQDQDNYEKHLELFWNGFLVNIQNLYQLNLSFEWREQV